MSIRPKAWFRGSTQGISCEEIIARTVWTTGPVIALGEPGQPHGTGFAARDPVEDRDWHDVVAEHIKRSTLIIVIVGNTPGLAWELRAIEEQQRLADTLLLLLPPADSLGEHNEELAALNRWYDCQDAVGRRFSSHIRSDHVANTIAIRLGPEMPIVAIGHKRNEAHIRAALLVLNAAWATQAEGCSWSDSR